MPARLPDHLKRTASQRAKEWRARQGELGLPPSRGKSGKGGKHHSLFDRGEFVAVDGEGFSEGGEREWIIGASGARYAAQEHYYALLSASDGSEIYAPSGRLDTKDCLDFLLQIRIENPRAILVCFGGSYDVTQMLAFGLTRDQIKELTTNPTTESDARRSRKYLDVSLGEHDYRLEYRPRKSFTVMRWRAGADKYTYNAKGVRVLSECAKATLWDVWGFFQDSFAGVMRKWIPDHSDYQFIARMKGERSIFQRSEIREIREYNQAELRCLVAIMEKLRDAVRALGLSLTRWDGAGAIAGAMNKHHEVQQFKSPPPDDVFMAARHAYSGGHIEVCQLGYHDGPTYHYDVNSAYPAEFTELPSLAHGHWTRGTGEPPAGFTCVRVRWQFHHGNAFYPLFYREQNGSILYPADGEGWYWMPEYEAAREYALSFGAKVFEVIEWHHFKPQRNAPKPFGWVRDYYGRRQRLIAEAIRTGVASGEEKVIKLGLNSLYGKTAQQVGARWIDGELKPPSYFQLEWAGYVTSGCRAKLMRAAMQNPGAVIGFATDGLFSILPLTLDCPTDKVLGAWEAQVHDGITMVMPGVYWLHHAGKKPQNYSRGFDKKQMSDAEFVHHAWAKKQDSVAINITRLIGLATACMSDTFWEMRGMFAASTRELSLNGDNSKRYPVMLYKHKPQRDLVPTTPRDRDVQFDLDGHEISAPYPIKWLDELIAANADDVSEMEEEREAIDAELA